MRRWSVAVLVLWGCESGMERKLEVTVPAAVAAGFSAAAPGVVVSDLGQPDGGGGQSYTLLCGQSSASLTLLQDLGFGCLKDSPGLEGTRETVRAWVQPMPASWNAALLCGARRDSPYYEATRFAPADAGAGDAGAADAGAPGEVAPEPLAPWAQGTGTGTWKRDGSLCGGILDAKLTLAAP